MHSRISGIERSLAHRLRFSYADNNAVRLHMQPPCSIIWEEIQEAKMVEKGLWRWDDKGKDFLIVRESPDGAFEHLEPGDVNRLETERADLKVALREHVALGERFRMMDGMQADDKARALLARLDLGDGVKA